LSLWAAFSEKLGARGQILGRNLGWNIGGQVLPLVAGLVFVPLLLSGLGTARYGFLSLVWVLIGYFSLFDLGLSRALTQRVSLLGAQDDQRQVRTAVATGMALICGLALLSVPLLLAGKGALLDTVVRSGSALSVEGARAFRWLILGVPVVILAAGVRGVLEGQQRFVAVNLVRIPAGVMMFVGPWLATQVSPTLEPVTFAVFVVRLLQLLGFAWQARGVLAGSARLRVFDRDEVRILFGFGLWMTVSNIIGPLMVYLDRFVIARFGDLADVSYYSAPFDLLSRSLFLSAAVAGVMFPAISAAVADGAGRVAGSAGRLVRQHYGLVVLFFLPPLALVVVFAETGLSWWLGAAFAAKSALVMQVLAMGIFVNALASVPTAQLHAIRRADITAKCHLIELPVYLVVLVWLVQTQGILGAALAWTGRAALDLGLLAVFAKAQYRRINSTSRVV